MIKALQWFGMLSLTLGGIWIVSALIDSYGWSDAFVAVVAALMITTCLWWLIHCQRGGDD